MNVILLALFKRIRIYIIFSFKKKQNLYYICFIFALFWRDINYQNDYAVKTILMFEGTFIPKRDY